jgi:hypothetical protein
MSLQTELTTDPLNRGYQQYVPDSPGVIVNMMNEPIYSMPKTLFVTARGILAQHGETGALILDKLELAAAGSSVIKWAMKFITSDGIDVGHPTTQTMLDSMVGTVLTQTECDLLKQMAAQPASRAEVLGLGFVTEADVRTALGL